MVIVIDEAYAHRNVVVGLFTSHRHCLVALTLIL